MKGNKKMRTQTTRKDKLSKCLAKVNQKLIELEQEKRQKQNELEKYLRRHPSLKFDGLETSDPKKLLEIYDFLDEKYPVEWEGGIRCDDRGMALYFWLDEDPDFLIIHLSSTSKNICFSGSTSWRAKAPSLDEKVAIIKQIKKDLLKIINK